MVLLGDVLAVVAALFGVCLSAWATLVACSLLFPSRTDRAADAIRATPGRILGWGGLWTSVLGFLGIVLLQQPLPLAKLIGWLFLLALLSLAAVGATGLATVLARRVEEREPALSGFAALTRGAAFVVVPGILPVFGWFLVAPAVVLVGVGAGVRVLRRPKAISG